MTTKKGAYIYTVQEGGEIVALFTTKRELADWLGVRKTKEGWRRDMRVLRFVANACGRQSGAPMGEEFWGQFA